MSARKEILSDTHFCSAVRTALHTVSVQIILPYFGKLSAAMIETKSAPTDFVTLADIESEHYLTRQLSTLLPDAVIIGEEASASNSKELLSWPKGWVWTIDPLDGTRNFVNNNNNFCSMISLICDGITQAAWIYRPLEKDCFQAIKGRGIEHFTSDGEGKILSYKPAESDFLNAQGTANAMGLEEPLRMRARQKLKTHSGRMHIGSAGLDAVAAALGKSQFVMHSKLTPWDSCPAVLMCEEAGFYVRLAPDGKRFSPLSKGALMMTKTEKMWQKCCDFIFNDAP